MNHEMAFSLELAEQTQSRLHLRLNIQNQSHEKLLLPYPEIHNLQFQNLSSNQISNWYTHLLISAGWRGGILLQPKEVNVRDFHVRPQDVAIPKDDEDTNYNYRRWCVEMPLGDYVVWLKFKVAEDYFCCDTHMQFEDLLRVANKQQAALWTGKAESNRLRISRT